jgi:hypothetical protein
LDERRTGRGEARGQVDRGDPHPGGEPLAHGDLLREHDGHGGGGEDGHPDARADERHGGDLPQGGRPGGQAEHRSDGEPDERKGSQCHGVVPGELIERERACERGTGAHRLTADEVEPAQGVERQRDGGDREHQDPEELRHHASLLAATSSAGLALGRHTRQVCAPGEVKNLWRTP